MQSKVVQLTGGQFPLCELCPDNHVPTTDKLNCLPCLTKSDEVNNTVACTACGSQEIRGKINRLSY
jgi:hypothetical protein